MKGSQNVNPEQMVRIIESGIRSSVPWSRDYNLTPEIETLNKTLQKSLQVESRFRDINQKLRVKTLERQKSLSNSLILNEQRKKMLLEQKQKHTSLHSKKVSDKLAKFHTTQKIIYRKATANQKRFSETISTYWKDKAKQNQQREKRIYRLYSSGTAQQKAVSNSAELSSVRHQNERQVWTAKESHVEKEQSIDRGQEVRNRMEELSEQRFDLTFQNMMKKLAKINKRKKMMRIKSLKTDPQESNTSIQFNRTLNPSPTANKRKKIFSKNRVAAKDTNISSSSLMDSRKILHRHAQNKEAREQQQRYMFNEHSEYLENYKHRVTEINKIRQLRDKIIEKKLYVQRQQIMSKSGL